MAKNPVVIASRPFLEKLKMETAQELGLQNYATSDKGNLPSRVNGSVGGYMVKKLIYAAEQKLANQQ